LIDALILRENLISLVGFNTI